MSNKEAQVNGRSEYVQGVERNTVQKMQVLHDHNILVHEFEMPKDRVTSDSYKVVIHPDRVPRGEHERRFVTPNPNEIAAVVVTNLKELDNRASDQSESSIALTDSRDYCGGRRDGTLRDRIIVDSCRLMGRSVRVPVTEEKAMKFTITLIET
ncbi:helitron_like_N domain-containing protein [Trichonephila clavipes]|nr:helitron_like_N domain-containing protein [Trichonephila clavipes]